MSTSIESTTFSSSVNGSTGVADPFEPSDTADDWLAEAMRLAHDCTMAYSDMEHDSEQSHFHEWVARKRKLRQHLQDSMEKERAALRGGIV